MNPIKIIGYSGHSYVCIDSYLKFNRSLDGYFEIKEKNENPYNLKYCGNEVDSVGNNLFITIGDNLIRSVIYNRTKDKNNLNINIIDPSSYISSKVDLSFQIYVGSNAIINSKSIIKKGCIINTGAIIEHECSIKSFTHIAPGATLCGNVSIGENCIVGSNSVILPNISIGNNVTIGAGSVVTKNIPNNCIVHGNPASIKKYL